MRIIVAVIITLLGCYNTANGENKSKGTNGELIKCDHEFVSFNGTVFTDMNHQWVYIPPKFKNSLITSIKGREKEPLEFSVLQPTKITLLTGRRDKPILEKDGWKVVDTAKWTTSGEPYPAYILEKHLEKGEYDFFTEAPVGIRLIQVNK